MCEDSGASTLSKPTAALADQYDKTKQNRVAFIVLVIRLYGIFPSLPVDLCVLKHVVPVWNTTREESSPLFNQAL